MCMHFCLVGQKKLYYSWKHTNPSTNERLLVLLGDHFPVHLQKAIAVLGVGDTDLQMSGIRVCVAPP